jgi:hypothetical protein
MEDAEHKRLGALLAAHKSKKAHEEYLRHAERAALAGRRADGAHAAIKRHPKVKSTESYDLAHEEF